jgi:hypothetical protein
LLTESWTIAAEISAYIFSSHQVSHCHLTFSEKDQHFHSMKDNLPLIKLFLFIFHNPPSKLISFSRKTGNALIWKQRNNLRLWYYVYFWTILLLTWKNNTFERHAHKWYHDIVLSIHALNRNSVSKKRNGSSAVLAF